jgi:serine/threonine protein phosphatase PrpC
VVVACDGVWDVLTDQDVVNDIATELYKKDNGHDSEHIAAQTVAKHALAKGSTDNVTVVVVAFKWCEAAAREYLQDGKKAAADDDDDDDMFAKRS